jgi:uncharacterized protein (TIGR03382 family)
MGETVTGITSVVVPADVEPGIYYLGLSVDALREVFEHDRLDNTMVSSPVTVVGEALSILTDSLPPAELQGHYSARLFAHGGNGVHRWMVREGATLPLGLSLVEETNDLGDLATFLRGVPASLGTFTLALEVQAGDLIVPKDLQLEVLPGNRAFSITTDHLAEAVFGARYVNPLAASGGTPPYTWDVRGELPLGILLRGDGTLSGVPEQDGDFSLTFSVRDSAGLHSQKQLGLHVATPPSLTCVTKRLPVLELGASARTELVAAGGRKFSSGGAYRWKTESTARIAATSLGEEGEILTAPPPGLSLVDGWVMGAPTEFGTFVWKLTVRDDAGDEILCPVLLEVPADHGLTVMTRGLPTAIAGRSYRAHLAASGGDGALRWSEFGDGRVLADLGLGFDGSALVGTPSLTALEGEQEKVFTFLARVEDEKGRVGYHALGLRLLAEASRSQGGGADEKGGGGCDAAGAGALAPGFLALLALGLSHRRRSR